MNPEVLNYLMKEESMTEKVGLMFISNFKNHPDILEEFTRWIETRQYPRENIVSVQGYTAQMLSATTDLHPVGVYDYLIYLRERPTEAIEKLRNGFKIK